MAVSDKLKVRHNSNIVYYLGDDESLAEDLVTVLEQSDYRVRRFVALDDLEEDCEQEVPVVIIMDTIYRDGVFERTEIFNQLKSRLAGSPPLIIISARDDIETRLAAARMGAHRYFCKPLNIKKLTLTLEGLTAWTKVQPYRVLLIDDDNALLECYATVLNKAGMEVKALARPLEGLKVLTEFKPDVVVIDVYMPECSGPELAQVIRQDDAWAQMPVIFLSGESDLDRQLSAINLGGDDFLVKPVEARHLVAAITARAKRARYSARLNMDLKNALRESEFNLATMDQHDLVSTADITGRITSVNDKFCEISGYSRDELLGINHRILKSGHHSNSFYDDMWDTISRGKVWHGTICNLNKDGSEYWVESTIVPFLDETGKPYKYVSARTDITELKVSEERLERSQTYAEIGTWDWDIRNDEVYWSDRVKKLYGYVPELKEVTYEHFIDVVHPEDKEMVNNAVNACLENGIKYEIEHRVVWPDGNVRWMLERGDVIRNDDGENLHMLGVVQDITARKKVELALLESEQQLLEAQTLASIGSWQADFASGKLTWSDEIYRIFGHEPGSFEPSVEAFHAAVHPDDLTKVLESEKRANETGDHDVEHRIIRPDGTVNHVHELAKAETDASGSLLRLTGTVQDITARVMAEEKNRRNYQIQNILGSILKASLENIPLEKVLQRSIDVIIGSSVISTKPAGAIFLVDEPGQTLVQVAEKGLPKSLLTKCGQVPFGTCHCGKAAETRKLVFSDCLDHHHEITYEGIEPHGHYCVPILLGSKLLGVFNIYLDVGHQPSDEEHEFLEMLVNTLAVIIDRKQAEKSLIDAHEEAENANRAKSQFLSSMSHELRTPMNAIMGFGQLLGMEGDSPLSESQQENVDEINKASNHLLELINEVLDLAKIEAGRIDLSIEAVVLNDVLAESLQLITPLAQKRGIQIKLTHDGNEIMLEQLLEQRQLVRVDRTRLKQVLLNLLSNAVKYNRENGTITIDCINTDDNQIRLSITDTGYGLTQDQQEHLFEAFNRLGAEQAEIEGTGIGLLITKNIVELMGGQIGMNSQPNEGSTFWIVLPSDSSHPANKKKDVLGKDEGSHGVTSSEYEHTVLYIEDNPANLRLVTQLLARRPNIHMWSAHEPLLGLELATEHKPDLILLDINLPGMDGFEVLSYLRKQKATCDTHIIAISANAMPTDIEKGLESGFDDYITKPINVTALLKAVDTVLSEEK